MMDAVFAPFRTLREVHGAIAAFGCMALVFLMPIAPTLLPVLLIVAVAGLIVEHRLWKPAAATYPQRPVALWLLIVLFLLHVVGLAWSVNMDYGAFDLQIKLPFLLLPLVFLVLPDAGRMGWETLFGPWVLGNAVAVMICLVSVPMRVLGHSDTFLSQEIFGERFSYLIHPSYFALYLCFALTALLLVPMPWSSRRVHGFLAVLLCIGIALCGSKAGWATLVMMLGGVLLARRKDKTLRRSVLRLVGAFAVAVAVLVTVSSGVRERLSEAWRSIAHAERIDDASSSSEVRKLAWTSAEEVARAHAPWGTGTGDVKDELIAMHERNGYVHLVEKRINAHSEYLQLWAALGVPGLVLMLLLAVIPVFRAMRYQAVLAALFFGANALNWVVESMLEVQAGVVFFTFFACVLAIWRPVTPHPASPHA